MEKDFQEHNYFNEPYLGQLIIGMRNEYKKGENAMEYARSYLASINKNDARNNRFSTMIAYDLQAGTYIKWLENNSEFKNDYWGPQLANLISPYLPDKGTLLEVGVGEATTLSPVIKFLKIKPSKILGLDISWSRIKVANSYLSKNSQNADLFVGDIFNIPLADNSIDVLYSSHSLEPNGGYEEILIKECVRVARKAVILVEPIYELATSEGKKRMMHHGYIRGLYDTAKKLNCSIKDYRLLEHIENPLNPSGVLTITKSISKKSETLEIKDSQNLLWQCPLTKTNLVKLDDAFFSRDCGISYPILRNIPLLKKENAIVASLFE